MSSARCFDDECDDDLSRDEESSLNSPGDLSRDEESSLDSPEAVLEKWKTEGIPSSGRQTCPDSMGAGGRGPWGLVFSTYGNSQAVVRLVTIVGLLLTLNSIKNLPPKTFVPLFMWGTGIVSWLACSCPSKND
jgi:hypothetical protein